MDSEENDEVVSPAAVERASMNISWPTDVRHVSHVTFDKFHGFLGLPAEFRPEISPRRAPSASAKVFGVSAESMQCSIDPRGNSIPTILLLLQKKLYEQGGLKAEGIFRINAENSQEEFVRDLLNRGVLPDGIDIHCLAGLIKSWFRELPSGLLDSLPVDQVIQCKTEEDAARLVASLPPTKAGLLDWAVNLMADVVEQHNVNKMNARNVAMVFAPNMTQMVDPLTALKHAVQVMNFLNMLILKALKERQESNSNGQDDPSPNPRKSGPNLATMIAHDQANCEANNSNEMDRKYIKSDEGEKNLRNGGKYQEILIDQEPVWDQESKGTGKIDRIDSVVGHFEEFW
ncbi:hypothetical protein LUZ60_013363 [Juncus effusus]|nr:hypothetical protein LUZ60_013363 [Juncus effusus]